MKLTPEEKALIAEITEIKRQLKIKSLSAYTKKKLKTRMKEIGNILIPDAD